MRRSIIVLCALATLLGACVERRPELSPADRERLREFVSNTAPTPQHPLEVQFDNGVQLLGYDISSEELTPGRASTITWYWHAAQDLDDGWAIFTHVADSAGENRLNQDGVGVVRELYMPGRWQAGQYIRDEQEITLPEDWNSDHAVFYLGLWNGPHRLTIRSGPNDGENRVRAASVPVASSPSAAAVPAERVAPVRPVRPPPTLRAERAAGPIRIDGRVDEAEWQGARGTAAFVNTTDGSPSELRATARVAYDDDNLYVAFEVEDDFVQNELEGADAHLWEQDAVEIMLDPGADGRNYFELQVSPTGEVFDTRYDTRRQPQPFGDVSWRSRLRNRVTVRGTANDAAEDQGYVAEIAIPWASFAAGDPPAGRPAPNDTWGVNFYVMDKRPGDGGQRSAGWSPTHEGDFHVPARFGRITFAPAPVAAAEASPVGAPGHLMPVPQLQLPPSAVDALRRQLAQGNHRDPRGPIDLPMPTPAPAN